MQQVCPCLCGRTLLARSLDFFVLLRQAGLVRLDAICEGGCADGLWLAGLGAFWCDARGISRSMRCAFGAGSSWVGRYLLPVNASILS